MDKKILITGGTGLVGRHLTEALQKKGYETSILTRDPDRNNTGLKAYKWDLRNKIVDERAFAEASHIVHLAGAGIADRKWTQEQKREIVDSRVKSSELLYYLLRNNKHNVKTVVSASAIGYYGNTGDKLMKEDAIAGYDFLANTCRQWEHAVNKIAELGVRTVNIRTGFVLAADGGAVPRLIRPVKLYVGAPLGEGNQYVSWIHIEDLVDIYIKAIEDSSMKGPYNAVAPEPVTNKELVKTIARILDKPMWLPPVPAGLLRFLLGERASVILSSNNVSNTKIEKQGFRFRYRKLEDALRSLLINE
jgi:uncharacterized protein